MPQNVNPNGVKRLAVYKELDKLCEIARVINEKSKAAAWIERMIEHEQHGRVGEAKKNGNLFKTLKAEYSITAHSWNPAKANLHNFEKILGYVQDDDLPGMTEIIIWYLEDTKKRKLVHYTDKVGGFEKG